MLMLGYALAIAIGLSLGLIGGGGSILAVPILVYVLGVPVRAAIAMSLFIVGVVSLLGAWFHWRQGNVNLKIAALFTPIAMVGTYLGSALASQPFITGSVQLVTFALVMVVAAGLMISDRRPAIGCTSTVSHAGVPRWLAIPLEGLGVGVLTGFVGVGGGFLVIPALVLLGEIPMKEAVGTSLVIIACKSASGFWGYVQHVSLDWSLMLGFTLAATLGILGGTYLSTYVDGKQLQKGFGYFVLVVAVFVLIKR